jgi:hypothetical protein
LCSSHLYCTVMLQSTGLVTPAIQLCHREAMKCSGENVTAVNLVRKEKKSYARVAYTQSHIGTHGLHTTSTHAHTC